jgi:SAM-dependent methyltransferase
MNLKNYIYRSAERIYINRKLANLDYRDSSEPYLSAIFDEIEDDPIYPHKSRKYIKDWPTKYHLDHQRLNLIEAFKDIINNGVVIELGAGTGILTGLLAYYNRSVDAIEGNIDRSIIIKKRLKFVDNVRVFVDDIYNADLPKEKYDFAIITGVLEYIPYYHSDFTATSIKNTITTLLKNVSKTLKGKGILFLAIENKFGAKYFSGCTEDHNEQFYSGIMGYPFKSAITFSKSELANFLQGSGFSNIQFYHCFPDYKLPKLFIRECKDFYDLAPSGLWRGYFEDYTSDRRYLFSEALFIENLINSQMLFEMSNSFVILASKSHDVNLQTDWIIKKLFNPFPNNTKNHHSVEILKEQEEVGESQYYVRREPLKIANATWEFSNEKYAYRLTYKSNFVKGESLYIKLLKALWAQDFNKLIHLINLIKTSLLERFPTDDSDKENYQIENYPVDYTAWNLIEDDRGELHFIDTKWVTKQKLPIDFIIFRTLFYMLYEESPGLNTSRQTIKDWIVDLMKQIFPTYDYDRFIYNLTLETDFIAFATGEDTTDIVDIYKKILFSAPYAKRLDDKLIQIKSELDHERQIKTELQTKIEELKQDLELERQIKTELQTKIEELKQDLELERQIKTELQTKIDTFTMELLAEKQMNQDLQKSINRLTNELNEIYSSKSWRITEPVRWVRQKLSQMKNII